MGRIKYVASTHWPQTLGVSPSKKQMGMKPKKAMLHVVYMQHCKLQCCDWTRSAYPLLLAGSPLLAEQVRQAGANCADFVYQVVYIVNIEVNDNRTFLQKGRHRRPENSGRLGQENTREDGSGQLPRSPPRFNSHEGRWLCLFHSLGYGCQDVRRSPSSDDLSF